MSSGRSLSAEEETELNAWLSTEQIQLSKRTCRELSDVKNISKLFRKLNSKLVDAHTYVSHSSLALKIKDWENFNFLVLRKLGMSLPRPGLKELACGKVEALKVLLYQLMEALRSREDCEKSKTATNNNTISLKPKTEKHPVDDHMKSYLKNKGFFEKYLMLREESERKDDFIQFQYQKIKNLEEAKEAKDDQINDLVKRLAEVSVQLTTLQILIRYKGRRRLIDDDEFDIDESQLTHTCM